MRAYDAIDRNRVNKIQAYYHDIERYAQIIMEDPGERLDYDDKVEKVIKKLEKENSKVKKHVEHKPIELAPAPRPLAVKDDPIIHHPTEPRREGVKPTPKAHKKKPQPPKEVQGSLF